MHHIFTCISFLVISVVGIRAQSSADAITLDLEPSQVERNTVLDNIDPDYEEVCSVRLTNVSGRSLQLRYDKILDHQQSGWRSVVFRRGGIGFSGDSGASDSGIFQIGKEETVEFQLIIQPNSISGNGRIRIPFVDAQNPGRPLATASFKISITQRGQRVNEAPSIKPSIRVFPNPAPEMFFVELPRNERFGRVEVFNTLGRRLKVFNEQTEDGFDIKNLPEGLYLVNIYNDRGVKLRTLRLLHPRGGA
ncbi:MAG: T9SS type A sorting domain-containing protein [Bacteroidota bacterium]